MRPTSGKSRDKGLPCYPRASPLRYSSLTRAHTWRAGPQYGMLRILVQNAYGIEVADLRGTSDPYVVVTSAGQKKKTTVIKKTLDPTWHETLELRGLLDDFLASGVKLTLFDWDGDTIGSDECLGEVRVTLSDELRLQQGVAPVREYTEGLSTQGNLVFSISWVPDTAADQHEILDPFVPSSSAAATVPMPLSNPYPRTPTAAASFGATRGGAPGSPPPAAAPAVAGPPAGGC